VGSKLSSTLIYLSTPASLWVRRKEKLIEKTKVALSLLLIVKFSHINT